MKDIRRMMELDKFKKSIGLTENLKINDGDGGVYIIYSLSTDYCYVGQTGNLKSRYGQHLTALRNNKHKRRKLQQIYNEFGKEDLVYIPVYKCPDFMRKEVERAYTYNLGLETVNVGKANQGFILEKIKEEILMGKIPKKYTTIIKYHKDWKYKDSYIRYSDYLSTMVESGMSILKNGFKWVDEIQNINNIDVIKEYRKNYDDFSQMQLDYVAIAILNDILGQEKNYNVFYRERLQCKNDFNSDDLIYNIYKEIRKDNEFRNDIILASSCLITYEDANNDCILNEIEMYKKALKIENVFDLLYVYIIDILINELIRQNRWV